MVKRQINRLSAVTLGTVTLLVGGCAAAAAATPVSSAVTVAGTVGGPGSSAVIAHPSGGVIAKLFVHDGDTVDSGDVLFRLMDGGLSKRQKTLEENHVATLVRLARLRAEARGAESIELPEELRQDASSDVVQNALSVEREKLQTDRTNLDANLAEIATQTKQTAAPLPAYGPSAHGSPQRRLPEPSQPQTPPRKQPSATPPCPFRPLRPGRQRLTVVWPNSIPRSLPSATRWIRRPARQTNCAHPLDRPRSQNGSQYARRPKSRRQTSTR